MDSKASSLWMPKGIAKSNSTASTSGRSTKSYDSVKGIGVYAFGTLHLVRHDDSPRHSFDGDEDDGPPPLEPPSATTQYSLLPQTKQPASPRNAMLHAMGGGDIVLVLHLPEAYTIGYDTISFSAKHFIGIRSLPAGPHFFWASNSAATSVRSGFWIMSSGVNRVHVVQWHRYNEVFVRPTRTETRIQAENVDKIFDQLPQYRDPTALGRAGGEMSPFKIQTNINLWRELTCSLDQTILDRIMAEQEEGWNVHTCDRVKGSLRLPGDMDLDRRLAHPVFQSHELKFSFEQQTRTYSLALVGRARTRDARDSTSHIISWMTDAPTKRLSEDDIVGELQFAYVAGVYMGNNACIQQWWYMVLRLFLRAYRLVLRRPQLAAALLRTIAGQLAHSIGWVDESILDYSEANARKLRVALIIYRRRMKELILGTSRDANVDRASVSVAFSRLEGVVAQLGWDLQTEYLRKGKIRLEDGEDLDVELSELEDEDERGEWAPEIIELDEYGRQIGLVSLSS
ncbi:AAR2 protein [Hirsutella rhossiliensis]|uniref:AAR2 protein n=1 Tax=Hirsutella rhossiliensis TaxID=111463 RepID=A0A9P8MRM4_9HYPO|nr:AAR2 protein [Hirsutella rhossiliensis]KAH0960137.1 AAR2 protein [Hirsutella rhossiliensis]